LLGIPKPFRSFPSEMAARLMTLKHAADRTSSSQLMKAYGIGKSSTSRAFILRKYLNFHLQNFLLFQKTPLFSVSICPNYKGFTASKMRRHFRQGMINGFGISQHAELIRTSDSGASYHCLPLISLSNL